MHIISTVLAYIVMAAITLQDAVEVAQTDRAVKLESLLLLLALHTLCTLDLRHFDLCVNANVRLKSGCECNSFV